MGKLDTPNDDEEICYHSWETDEVGNLKCKHCDAVSKLSKRCISGEHCMCKTGFCCWCGYVRPSREMSDEHLKAALDWWIKKRY